MNMILRLLIKFILVIFFLVITLLLMTFIGLKLTFSLIFLTVAKNIWSYRPVVYSIESQVEDYYAFMGLEKGFKDDELKSSFNEHLENLNNNFQMNYETKLILTRKLQDIFDMLNNPVTRADYENRYSDSLQELELIKQKNSEQKPGFIEEIKGMLSFRGDNLSRVKGYLAVGLVIAIVFDIVIFTV